MAAAVPTPLLQKLLRFLWHQKGFIKPLKGPEIFPSRNWAFYGQAATVTYTAAYKGSLRWHCGQFPHRRIFFRGMFVDEKLRATCKVLPSIGRRHQNIKVFSQLKKLLTAIFLLGR